MRHTGSPCTAPLSHTGFMAFKVGGRGGGVRCVVDAPAARQVMRTDSFYDHRVDIFSYASLLYEVAEGARWAAVVRPVPRGSHTFPPFLPASRHREGTGGAGRGNPTLWVEGPAQPLH